MITGGDELLADHHNFDFQFSADAFFVRLIMVRQPYFWGSWSKDFSSEIFFTHGNMLSQKMFIAGFITDGSFRVPAGSKQWPGYALCSL